MDAMFKCLRVQEAFTLWEPSATLDGTQSACSNSVTLHMACYSYRMPTQRPSGVFLSHQCQMRRALMCIAQSVGANGQNDRADVKTVQILLNFYSAVLGLQAPLAEDGAIGPNTLAAIGTFQSKVVGMAQPDQRVNPGGTTLARLHDGLPAGL